MSNSSSLPEFDTFGELLRHLRRRARLTQRDLGQAVGYSETHITRLENGQRLPDLTVVKGVLIEALDLKHEPELANRLIELAAKARGDMSLVKYEREALARARTNLPAQLTSFVGREREIAEVKELLGSTRLLTLIGAGGVGKTRLAQESAANMLSTFPDGVWYVELAALTDSALVPQAITATLKLIEQPGRAPLDAVADYFEAKQALLILDNCEHLIVACADLAMQLLQRCPGLRILATSRETLRVPGEMVYRVPSLTIPPLAQDTTDLSDYESVRLFIERALASQPALELTPTHAADVVQICRRLDGIPLALELAAARLTTLTPRQIVERLDDRFSLLTTGARTALPRQQTLRATIAWSVDLLTQAERDLLARLSVFAGGFAAEAAEALFEQPNTLDVLSNLVEKSIVIADVRGEQARYRMLETIREYAQECLKAIAMVDVTRCKHAQYFLRLAEEAETKLWGKEQVAWLNRVEVDHDNLRAALRYSKEGGETEVGLRLVGALNWFWTIRGFASEGRNWTESMFAVDGASNHTAAFAKALRSTGSVGYWQGSNTLEVRSLFEESLRLSRAVQDKQGVSEALWYLGVMAADAGDYVLSHSLHQESLTIAQELGNQWRIHESHHGLGLLAAAEGDYRLAHLHFEKSLMMCKQSGATYFLGPALIWLGLTVLRLGDYTAARSYFEESIAIRREVEDKPGMSASLEGLAGLVAAQGQAVRSARLFGAAQAVRDTFGARLPASERAEYAHNMAAARAALSDAEFEAAYAEGCAMTLEQAIDYALADSKD